tara:strand:+ start:1002 stop:1193 length:192 start_codon:yes stop_codon:yes gene_type:complete
MKAGDIVVVETKHYGYKTGIILQPWFDQDETMWLVEPFNHSRQLICHPTDITVITNNIAKEQS